MSIRALSPALWADLVAASSAAIFDGISPPACAAKAAGISNSNRARSRNKDVMSRTLIRDYLQSKPLSNADLPPDKAEVSMGGIGIFYHTQIGRASCRER